MISVLSGDCREVLRTLPPRSYQTVVTSPPYWGLRDYGDGGAGIGLEPTFEEHVGNLLVVFREVWRVLRPDGTVWFNYGDGYASGHRTRGRGLPEGCKPKDLLFMPARLGMALQADGWWVRCENIWHKRNPIPESVKDRPTSAHEKVFLLTKRERYYYDAEAVKVPSNGPPRDTAAARKARMGPGAKHTADKVGAQIRSLRWTPKDVDGRGSRLGRAPGWRQDPHEERLVNLRNVWSLATYPYGGAHFATFPPALVEICLKAGSRPGDAVLDPFGGAGTVGLVAQRLGRQATLIELNPEYAAMAERRILEDAQ